MRLLSVRISTADIFDCFGSLNKDFAVAILLVTLARTAFKVYDAAAGCLNYVVGNAREERTRKKKKRTMTITRLRVSMMTQLRVFVRTLLRVWMKMVVGQGLLQSCQ